MELKSRQSSHVCRVAGYTRVSSLEQTDNWSLDQQKRVIQEYCAAKGHELVAMYTDDGHSAWKEKGESRPQYLRLMADAKAGKFDMVLTITVDRMSRSLVNMIATVNTLQEYNVVYKSLKDPYDFATSHGQLMLSIISVFAQHQSAQLSDHVKRGKEQRALAGLRSGRPPWGYELCDEHCVDVQGTHGNGSCHISKEKGAKVVELFELYATGLHSYRGLAAMMDKQGYRSNGFSADRSGSHLAGSRFIGSTIAKMLGNAFYMGQITHKGTLYPGIHEPLVSKELFDRVQIMREKNRKGKVVGRTSKQGHLLAKVARCHQCGATFHGTIQGTQQKVTYYRMAKKATGVECQYSGRSIRGAEVEDVIDQLFRRFELRPDWREYVITKFVAQTQVDELARQRVSLTRKRDRVNELYIEGEIERKERDARVSNINDELTATDVLPDYAVEEAGELLNDFPTLWTSASTMERNDLVKTVLDAVYIDFENRAVVAIQPNQTFGGVIRAMADRPDLLLTEAPEFPFSREPSSSPRPST